jgi:tetratricopeptide (TPR) repeat protein
MAVVDYQDFELEISSNTTGGSSQEYFGKVIRSPAGEAPRCPVKFWFSEPGVLAKLRTDLESAVLEIDEQNGLGLSSPAEMILRNFGREIFRSIFVNNSSINEIYWRSKGISRDLRIKLRIESQELAGLPWEYLYEEREMPGYVSLRHPVVRYLETMGPAGRMGVKGPLRILGMISDPATDVWPKLDVVKERDRIDKGIDSLQREGRVDFQWVSGGTGKDLMNKLLEGEWHVFHFIGHGGVEAPISGEDGTAVSFDESGFIVMVDESGKPVKKFASDLATMLLGARRSLRLVVLNCCESAKINVGERFGNPAIGLMRSGWLPAVVAMQFPITDGAAIRMSEGFYKALANNQPVDGAVTVARQFIQEQSRVEWGIPVLYMRSVDGKIFDVDNPVSARPGAGSNGPGKVSGEDLNQRRQDFLLTVSEDQNSTDELEQLTLRGQELLQHFKGDQELSVHLAKIYFDLGGIQQRHNQTSTAAASFAYALKLDPAKPKYYLRRANFNARQGLFENALTDIAEAIRLRPDNAEFYWAKGIICCMASGSENTRGFIEEAINSHSIAIAKNPQEPKYLMSRAHAYAQLKRKAEAVNDIDKAMALAPDNAHFIAERAKIANQMA